MNPLKSLGNYFQTQINLGSGIKQQAQTRRLETAEKFLDTISGTAKADTNKNVSALVRYTSAAAGAILGSIQSRGQFNMAKAVKEIDCCGQNLALKLFSDPNIKPEDLKTLRNLTRDILKSGGESVKEELTQIHKNANSVPRLMSDLGILQSKIIQRQVQHDLEGKKAIDAALGDLGIEHNPTNPINEPPQQRP